MVLRLLLATAVICLAYLPCPLEAQVPQEWVYAGLLYQYGDPFTGTVDMDIDVFESVEAEVPLWSESDPSVDVNGGAFVLRLGAGEQSIEPSLLTGDTLWIQLTVNGEVLGTRFPVASVPYAQRAEVAARSDNAQGVYIGATRVIDSSGNWTGTPLGEDQLDLDVDLNTLEEAMDTLADLESRIETLEESLALAEEIIEDQATTIDALSLTVLGLENRLQHVRREGTDLIIEGANLHIRSGGGTSYHSPDLDSFGTPNGLGNLIVGYDEAGTRDVDGDLNPISGATQGSHNIIVGPGHAYPGFGGLVLGLQNQLGPISGDEYQPTIGCFATGSHNRTGGSMSALVGGTQNATTAVGSFVIGGAQNTASGYSAGVVGGTENLSEGTDSVIVGGDGNITTGNESVIVGGDTNSAIGSDSVVVGGNTNDAEGDQSVVAGGSDNRTRSGQPLDTVVGGSDQTVSGGAHYCAPSPSCAADPD